MKKRILFFVASMGDGGAQRVISMLSKGLTEKDYQVEIVTYYDLPVLYEISNSVKLTCIERCTSTKNMIKNLIWFRSHIKNNCDVIISFLAEFNMYAIAASAWTNKKIIVADRNDPNRIPSRMVIRKLRDILYRFADHIVVQTNQNKDYFAKAIQKKTEVIFNPIALGSIAGCAMRENKRKKIVSVGRLMPQKNQVMLVDAFARLLNDFSDYELYIYGDGPERVSLIRHAKALGVYEKVHLPGSTNKVFDEIKDAEVFVLCSDYEGMPNALMEGMCLGLPCISTRVSGAEDIIDHQKNGEIIEIGDTEALYLTLRKYIENPNLRIQYAENAVLLNSTLSIDTIIKQWVDVIGDNK